MPSKSQRRFEIRPRPLERSSFAGFGEVIEAAGDHALPINQGNAQRFDRLAAVSLSSPDDRAVINIFRAKPTTLPLRIRIMERHPLGSQAFMPLQRQPFLIVVADDPLDAMSYRAFVSNGRQGVNYGQNIWHHPLIALDERSDFLVIDRDGPGKNLVEIELHETPLEIILVPSQF